MRASQAGAALVGPLAVAISVAGVVTVNRHGGGSDVVWMLVAIAGLIIHLMVAVKWQWKGWARWSPAGLAVLALVSAAVGVYGFRSCADLPDAQRCLCEYVGAVKPARGLAAGSAESHRAALAAACASDPALGDVVKTLVPGR